MLQKEGFSNWTKKDFSVFKSACERHGRSAFESIAQELENKDALEVKGYSAKFWELGSTRLSNWDSGMRTHMWQGVLGRIRSSMRTVV